MNSTCAPIGFALHEPFLLGILFAIGILVLPLGFLTTYVILVRSSRQMKVYRWYLLLYHSICFTFAHVVTFAAVPTLFTPLQVIRFDGYLSSAFHVSEATQAIIFLMTETATFIAIGVLFFYRMQVILPQNSRFKLSQRGCMIFTITIMTVFMSAVAVVFTGMTSNQEKIKMRYECMQEIFDSDWLFALHLGDSSSDVQFIALVLLACIGFSAAILIVVLTFRTISTMSILNRKRQQKIVLNLCIQVAIPTAIVALPTFTVIFLWYKELFGTQVIGDIAVILLASHGPVSSTAILVLNRPYKVFITGVLSRINIVGTSSSVRRISNVSGLQSVAERIRWAQKYNNGQL